MNRTDVLLSRISLALGAVVTTISLILLAIVGVDSRFAVSFAVGWLGLAAGVTAIAAGIESVLAATAKNADLQGATAQGKGRFVAQIGKSVLLALAVALLMTLIGHLLSDESSASKEMVSSIAGPAFLVSIVVHTSLRYLLHGWLTARQE